MQSPQIKDMAQDAMQAYQAGEWELACQYCKEALGLDKRRADVWALLGVVLRRMGKTVESEQAYRSSIDADAEYADAYYNLGNLLREQGRGRDAAYYYRVAISKRPGWIEALIALSDVLNTISEYTQGIHTCQLLISLAPTRPEGYNNLGNALQACGQSEQALSSYIKAREVSPGFVNAVYNQVLVLEKLDRQNEAASLLRQLVAQQPDHLNGWIKLGDAEKQAGRFRDATHCYQRALSINSNIAEVHNNLGVAWSHQNRWDEAVAAYLQAIELGAEMSQAWLNLGNAYHALRRFDDALSAYRAGLMRDPGNTSLLTELIHVQQKVCDWQGFDGLREKLLLPALAWDGGGIPPSPFIFLSLPFEVTPAEQQIIAGRYSEYVQSGIKQTFRHSVATDKKRLRIGYVSADFHNHATAHLMLGLFSRHDRQKFEIIGYSMGRDDGSAYRQRIQAECDRFIDIREMTDSEAAARMHADGIDILVDLKGYTGEARPAIFAHRPAPVQVAYLGYPGTMGADFIDYIIADPVVLPREHIPYYTEKPACLPHSYQVNDIDQKIASHTLSRKDCGLPENGFVFCCFNSPYKIEPAVFAIWMRILKAVPKSVLWLFAGQPTSMSNLRLQAERHGVAADRMVFAEHAPKEQHLARHQLADLFLDTLFYNAHTTASDALWAGVPVLTCPGNTFASRVAASLLKAVGLEEMIISDLEAYEALAIELATSRPRLNKICAQLQKNRIVMPLFDTDRFARDLERAYLAMWQNHASGLSPQPIYLD